MCVGDVARCSEWSNCFWEEVPLASERNPCLCLLVNRCSRKRRQFHWQGKWQISSSAPEGKHSCFFCPTKANEAVKRLTSECANIIRSTHQNDSGLLPKTHSFN